MLERLLPRTPPPPAALMEAELLQSPLLGLGEEDEADLSDWNLPLAFMKKRHCEKIEGSKSLAQSWRMKDRVGGLPGAPGSRWSPPGRVLGKAAMRFRGSFSPATCREATKKHNPCQPPALAATGRLWARPGRSLAGSEGGGSREAVPRAGMCLVLRAPSTEHPEEGPLGCSARTRAHLRGVQLLPRGSEWGLS